MNKISGFFIRVSAFLGKEIFEILRQPMLILTLILGPFMILLLFGLGFHNEPRALRTLVVAPAGSNLATEVKSYATSLGPQFIFAGVTSDKAAALEKLKDREVDVVVVVPPDAFDTIRNSLQVVLLLYYYEVDPVMVQYMNVFGRVYVQEINRRVLRNIIENEQTDASTVHQTLHTARQTAEDFGQALKSGNSAAIRQNQQQLEHDVNILALTARATIDLLDNVQQTVTADNRSEIEAIRKVLTNLIDDTKFLGSLKAGQTDLKTEQAQLQKVEQGLNQLDSLLGNFQDISAGVLVSPFRSETKNITSVSIRPLDFFAPSVIVLLLQHLAVTFAALSIVREHQEGMMELFRVAPISAFETLLGKYVSYLLIAGLLAAVLTALVVFGLGVPMLGSWYNYTLSLGAVIFTSLGIGFVVSLVARTDSQAVQFSMITLLATVFFSGAFMSLENLSGPVRVVSWTLPATYGVLLLQNIMLRGSTADYTLLLSLTTIGLALFVAALLLLRHRLAHS